MAFRQKHQNTTDLHEDLAKPTPEMRKAYRTRGWLMPLCGLLTAVVFCLMVPAWYGLGKGTIPPEYCLILGVLLSIVAIPLHLMGSSRAVIGPKRRKALCFCADIALNSLGTSLCMTAYFLHIATSPSASVLFAAILPSAVIYVLTALLMQVKPHRYALLTGILALATLGLIITAIVFWVRSDNKVFFSFGFFNLLWALISVVALHFACSDEESPALRFASFASFGILLGVAAIVLIILACAGGDCDCDGSCCDCGDCGCGGKEAPTTRGRKKNHT